MDGLTVVDKPGGMTSHDVVSRVRRLAHTRRVGHGGTLDPMATGVLVLGVGRATRLLTYVIGTRKRYLGTIRLGQSTVTDDAEGEVIEFRTADGVTDEAIRAGLAAQTGEIDQVPSAVSAIKVNGQRAYKKVRAGEEVALAPRQVTVSRLDVLAIRHFESVIDVDIDVECSSGTYIRAIARDLGAALGAGGHLTELCRTAVDGLTIADALTLEELEDRAPDVVTLPMAEAARRFLPAREATDDEAKILSHGGPLDPTGTDGAVAVFAASGALLAVVSDRDGRAKPEIVVAPAS
ncbi:MAG TPA: tRNA pseudouridine(55) synthase TruB [Asanoa sp.]